MRYLINGSFEPLWRRNARRDADRFKTELLKATPSRRAFLAGAGAAMILEYVATRRAVAFPFPHGSASAAPTVTGITNQRTGTTYPYVTDALLGMTSGDTLLLPAGQTYQYLGATKYYADFRNTDPRHYLGASRNVYLGHTSPYQSSSSADYGTLQGSGTANNGRALISPPCGIVAIDCAVSGSPQELFFDSSTPVSNFISTGYAIYVSASQESGTFAFAGMNYTGVSLVNNSLTGVTSNVSGTIHAGTIVNAFVGDEGKAIFIAAGQTPGWTLTNLEIAYGYTDIITCSVQQQDSDPNGPYVGSLTLNNCYVHDCKQGLGLGHADVGSGIFTHFFDTEITACGNDGQTHNIYIGNPSEFIMDNCWSHKTTGNWLVKTRAPLNIITYSQIRGERTDAGGSSGDSGGCDFSNGGLTYIIGCIHQASLHAFDPRLINYCAEGPSNPIQELYVVNDTIAAPSNGTGFGNAYINAPVRIFAVGVPPPFKPLLGQTGGGSLAARQYVGVTTSASASGETQASNWVSLRSIPGWSESNSVWQWYFLNVSVNNLLTIASPGQITGATGWNAYTNYNDPQLYTNYPYPLTTGEANWFFWDAGFTQPVFDFTTGGITVSITGTMVNGGNSITSPSALVGLAALSQLVGMTVYTGGVSTGFYVRFVNESTGVITLSGNYTGTTVAAGTITFGYYLWCGFTYQTALGDSYNGGLMPPWWDGSVLAYNGAYYDGSNTRQSAQYLQGAFVQVDPGKKLIVNAPPSGPAWATGMNFWATMTSWYDQGVPNPLGLDAWVFAAVVGQTKQNSSVISFGASYTSPASVIVAKSQQTQPNLFLQNASPKAIGANFTEATSGLVNNNPTQTKLQWYRRRSPNNSGQTQEVWYTVVPGGGLTGYAETIYFSGGSPPTVNGSVSIWRGCAADPFDANFRVPVFSTQPTVAITTASGNVTVIANYWTGSGTAGSGFTQVGSAQFLSNVAYKQSVAALTASNVTETGGAGGDQVVIDALVGTSSPAFVSSQAITSSGSKITFTVATANAGDVLYLSVGTSDNVAIAGIGKINAPILNDASGVSPTVLVQNCLSANFNPAPTGGWVCMNDNAVAAPGANYTVTTCLIANPFNGSIFGSPSFATVFADATQADLDYRLAVSSPALNSASNPGSSPEGQSLIPVSQSAWHGLPTPGTPIPAKAARTDIGPALTGSIGALT